MSTDEGKDKIEQQKLHERLALNSPDAQLHRNANAKTVAAAETNRTNASDGSLRNQTKVPPTQDDSIQIMGMAGVAASRKSKLSEKDLLSNQDPAARSIDIRELLAKPEKIAQELIEQFGRVTNMPAGPHRDSELLLVQLLADKTYKRGQFAQNSMLDAIHSHERRIEKEVATSARHISPAEKATAKLLETASQRFGSDKIQALHVKSDDIGSALSALALGPDVCKSFGPNEMHNLGNRFLVFGVAPMFGMAETAKTQLTQHTLEQINIASGNYLSGAAIGILLQNVHPGVLAAGIVGGASMFVHGQLSAPEHRARNRELAAIASKIDAASNAELFQFMGRTKILIGPDLYHGTFSVVTGTPAIPNGNAVNSVIKEEALSMSKFDAKDGIKVLQGLGNEAWEIIKPLLEQPRLRPAFAEGAKDISSANKKDSLADNILRMQSDGVDNARKALAELRDNVDTAGQKFAQENLEPLVQANKKLLETSNLPVPSREFADSLVSVENKLIEHIKAIRAEVTSLTEHAAIIEGKPQPSETENKILEKFYSSSDVLYQINTDRLQFLYKWNKDVSVALDAGTYISSGMGTQRSISNKISKLFEQGLERNEIVQKIFGENGIPIERARDWVGLPITGASAADHAGCDYLLANKVTGEMYTLDITERVFNMKTGSLIESRLINPKLEFPNKNIPKDRIHLVIGVADDVTRDNAIYNLEKNPNLNALDATKSIELQERKQIAEIIAQTISRKSILSIIDTPLPSALSESPPSRQVYELWRFGIKLQELGYSEWAASMKGAIHFIRLKNPNLPFY